MKNSIKILAVIALFGFVGNASAQSNQATGTASATIITPISLAVSGSLQFGNVIPPATGTGTVTVNYLGVTYAPPSMQPGTQAGTTGVPTFTATGQSGFTFAETRSALTGSWPAGLTIAFDGLPVGSGTLSVGGTATWTQGGILTVPAGVAPGIYTGTWTETVNYN